jgi:hypothetical protein
MIDELPNFIVRESDWLTLNINLTTTLARVAELEEQQELVRKAVLDFMDCTTPYKYNLRQRARLCNLLHITDPKGTP